MLRLCKLPRKGKQSGSKAVVNMVKLPTPTIFVDIRLAICMIIIIEQPSCNCMYVVMLVVQDAVILARKVQSLLQPESHTKGARPTTLRSVATSDLVQVLRDYEKERKSRTRLITIRSNLMGQALQIPFAPVSSCVHAYSRSHEKDFTQTFARRRLCLLPLSRLKVYVCTSADA